jgi:hypothetical protein
VLVDVVLGGEALVAHECGAGCGLVAGELVGLDQEDDEFARVGR